MLTLVRSEHYHAEPVAAGTAPALPLQMLLQSPLKAITWKQRLTEHEAPAAALSQAPHLCSCHEELD